MSLRNLWVTFAREVIFAGGIVKQQTSGYYGFENFRGNIQKNIAKMITILTSEKGKIVLENKGV